MTPTRRTQPYRKGARMPSGALSAMLRGGNAWGYNPMDVKRGTAKYARRYRPRVGKRRGVSRMLRSVR